MKAIKTKYLSFTETKPARIKVSAEGVPAKIWSVDAIDNRHDYNAPTYHRHAAAAADFAKLNGWDTELASGCVGNPDTWVHCFITERYVRRDLLESYKLKTIPITRIFRVAAISSTSNSFGLTGVILVARDGAAYEVAVSGHTLSGISEGDDFEVTTKGGNLVGVPFSYEIPRSLSGVPPAVVAEIWDK